MSNISEIFIQFNEAERVAKQIEETAQSLGRLSQSDMERIHQDLSIAWKGDNARQYLNKSIGLQASVQESSQTLTTVAQTIRSSAQKLKDAEAMILKILTGH